MGVGDPVSIVEAVALGIDMFDCVLPTRLARHGTLLTDLGRLNIKRSEFARSDDPVGRDPARAPLAPAIPGAICATSSPSARRQQHRCARCTTLTWMFTLVVRQRCDHSGDIRLAAQRCRQRWSFRVRVWVTPEGLAGGLAGDHAPSGSGQPYHLHT